MIDRNDNTVLCSVSRVEIKNRWGRAARGVRVTCGRCQETSESSGVSGASVRRCMVLLREKCPRAQRNYYVAEGHEDERE